MPMLDLISYPSVKEVPVSAVPELTFVKDLLDFEGPLLTLFRDSAGADYLYYWADCDSTLNRWMIVKPPQGVLELYLNGTITLRAVLLAALKSEGHGMAVDMNRDAGVEKAWLFEGDDPTAYLPDNYMPGENSYYKDD